MVISSGQFLSMSSLYYMALYKVKTLCYASRMETMPKEKHGTLTGYQYYGCRCEKCRAANAARAKRLRDHWRNQAAKQASK